MVEKRFHLSVQLNGVQYELECPAHITLLDSLLSQLGTTNVPFSCQDGECGACMARLRHGKVNMRANRVLSDQALAQGYVLCCQALPVKGPLLIDYDN